MSLLVSAPPAGAQIAAATLPPGVPLSVEIDTHVPQRIGQSIRAHLLYPVYAGNLLLLPEGTPVLGSIAALAPDRPRRLRARLGLDFSRYSKPVVQFTSILLPNGDSLSLPGVVAAEGAPIFRINVTPPVKGSFLHRQFAIGLQIARDHAAILLAPGKRDRLEQFLLGQLPYHVQRVEQGTSWTIEIPTALDIPAQPAPLPANTAAHPPKPHWWMPQPDPPPAQQDDPAAWTLQADLNLSLSSATTAKGAPIQAIVAEPIYNPDHTLAVPQGARLLGTVTEVKPARFFGRTGVLRLDFGRIQFPNAAPGRVQATVTGADSNNGELTLDSEGAARPRPRDKIGVPLLLAFLASQTLDSGGHESGGNGEAGRHNAQGANGIGVIGNIVGYVGKARVAAAIGYYGTALSFYDRWIARGKEVAFAKDTRIVLQTTARRSASITTSPRP